MNEPRQDTPEDKDADKSLLNRMARKVDPPSREPGNEELKDPGRATPDAAPTDNRS